MNLDRRAEMAHKEHGESYGWKGQSAKLHTSTHYVRKKWVCFETAGNTSTTGPPWLNPFSLGTLQQEMDGS